MADFFLDPYFGLYFPGGYYGPSGAAPPVSEDTAGAFFGGATFGQVTFAHARDEGVASGDISASLSGAGAVSATLTGVEAEAAPDTGGGGVGSAAGVFPRYAVYRRHKVKRNETKQERLERELLERESRELVAPVVRAEIKPAEALPLAGLSPLVVGQSSDEIIAGLKGVALAAAERQQKQKQDRDDEEAAIVLLLLS